VGSIPSLETVSLAASNAMTPDNCSPDTFSDAEASYEIDFEDDMEDDIHSYDSSDEQSGQADRNGSPRKPLILISGIMHVKGC
jgi:hypothetical protein